MRLFAAVDPPAAAVAPVLAALGERDERLRYVPVEQWHVTTAFYGEVPDTVVPDLVERLARAAARTAPLTLRLAGAGTFPSGAGRAGVLWVGLAGDVEGLRRLAERCAAAGRRAGLDLERRRFRPHLTVARSRRGPVDLRPVLARVSDVDGDPWPVRSLRLVHSTLGSSVDHRVLHEWDLTGTMPT